MPWASIIIRDIYVCILISPPAGVNIRNVGKKKKRRIDNKNIKAVNKFFVFMFVFLKFIFESNIIEALIVKIIKKYFISLKFN